MTTAQDPVDQPASDDLDLAAVAADLETKLSAVFTASKLPESGPVSGAPDGSITVEFTTGPVRFDRPTFGQIKPLIRAEGRMKDKLQEIEYLSRAQSTAMRDRLASYQGAGKPGEFEITLDNLPGLSEVRDEARKIAEANEDAMEAALVEWWTLVFETLLGPVPQEDWPVDLLDTRLPGRVIFHWRYTPAGPG